MLIPTISETSKKIKKVKEHQVYSFVNVILSFFFFFFHLVQTKCNTRECGKLKSNQTKVWDIRQNLSHAPGTKKKRTCHEMTPFENTLKIIKMNSNIEKQQSIYKWYFNARSANSSSLCDYKMSWTAINGSIIRSYSNTQFSTSLYQNVSYNEKMSPNESYKRLSTDKH